MNGRRKIFLVLAVIMGLGTLMMMRAAIAPKQTAQAPTNIMEVMVANADIPAGQFIQSGRYRWQSWAPEYVTEAFIKKPISGKEEELDVTGAVARQKIAAGQPIMKGQIVKPKDRGFLAAVLDAGKRAIAAPITNVTGIAGFVFPGDRIDLILTHAIRSHNEDAVNERRASMTIVQDVRVLALDQNTGEAGSTADANNKPKVATVVTLEVTPKQAEMLTLALQLGTISLSLRSLATEEITEVAQQNTDGNIHALPIGFEKGFEKSGYTLDSEVSNIIPRPVKQDIMNEQVVQVLRGSKTRDEENFIEKKTP
jgi:pilus assembly protein CpaB